AAITGTDRNEASRFSCAREPAPQANRPVVSSLNRISSIPVTASNAIARAEPARTSRVVEGPAAAPDRPSTTAAAPSPPRQATPADAHNGTASPDAATAVRAR